MSTIQFVSTTPEALASQIAETVASEISKQLKSITTTEEESEYMTPDETAKLLSVNKSTLWRHQKNGLLTTYSFAGRVYYKRSEVLSGFSKNV